MILSNKNRLNFSILASCIIILSLITGKAQAQVIWSSGSGSAWMTGSNWTGGAAPGTGDIAQFNTNPPSPTTGIGINMDTASGAVSIGAIYVSSARTNNLFIGNSSPSTPGTLSLTGATVTVPNVVIANFSANNSRFIIQNTQGAGASTLGINLGSGSSKILTGPGSPTGIGNTIIINSIMSGSGSINFLGGGTWDATASTGNNGGLLRLGAANSFTGGIAVGSSDGTSSGILQLDSANNINNVSGNNVTINPNSQLLLAAPSGTTFNTSNVILNLNGHGNNYATTGKGALVNVSGNSYTWDGNLNLASDATISVLGSVTTSLTATGNVTGSGQLIKTGAGNLILSGSANTWAGGTQINAGKITVASGSAMSTGPLQMAQVGVNPVLVLNNTGQSVSNLSSSFTSTASTNTITLNGTRFIINQSANTEYGGATSALNSVINGSGSVVKTGTGTLKLTSPNNTFSGGLTITAGKIKLNPSSGTAVTNSSPDTLNGGTLSTDSIGRTFTFTLGTLAVTENSTIELGSDTLHTLRFAASSSIAWTSGKTLTITNWVGGYNGTAGTKGKIFIGTSAAGLSAAQLAQIKFDDGAGHLYNAVQLSAGEIVPAAPVITTTTASYGPFCNNVATAISVSFTSVGPFSGSFLVQLSGPTGVFPADFTTGIIGSGSSSPISATLPSGTTAGTGYRLRVINATPTPTFGSNNGSNIIITGAPTVAAINGPSAIANGGTANYTDATAGGIWTNSNATVATVSTSGVVTALSIGTDTLTYTVTNSCGIPGSATKIISVVPIPSVTSFSPLSGIPGSSVTIIGTNFNSTPTNNIVYFGATRAAVTSGSTTLLNVTVPVNATYDIIAVTDTVSGLTAFAKQAFLPTYTNTGLTANAVNFKPLVSYSAGSSPVGISVSDFDGDGRADVVVTNSGPNNLYIYRNIGSGTGISSGTFASPIVIATGAGPHYLKIADIDGDGKQDIILANTSTSSNKVSVLRNTSTTGISFATRVDYATGGSAPIDVSIADYDNDGKPDIAVVNQGSAKIGVLRNLSSPGIINATSFASAVTFSTGLTPFKIVSADLDGDGLTDMAVTNYSANTISLFHNNGTTGAITTATFATATTLSGTNAPTGIASGDIDADGKADLLITNSGAASLSVYRNTFTTAGTFAFASNVDFATATAPEDLALGDIDGDGKLDVAVGNYTSNTISIFRNTATSGSITTGSLASPASVNTGANPAGIALSDLDGDGKPDIAVANGGSSSVSFIKNYPLPPIGAITGVDSMCSASTSTFTNTVSGGTWLSKNPSIATIGTTGLLTAIAAGTDTLVYYTVAQGDTNFATHVLTVDANITVAAITGGTSVCIGAILPLSNAVPGGTWHSSDTSIATVSSTGFVNGRVVGSAVITYSISNTCGYSQDTAVITVNPSSGYSIGAISGASVICAGTTSTFTDTTAGGQWSSNDTAIARVNNSGLVTGVASGTTTITYGFTGSCGTYLATRSVSVDTTLHADSITGPNTICQGNTATLTDAAGSGGTWAVSNSRASIGATTGILTALSTGIDTVIYTITNACGTSTGRKVITINPQPFAAPITGAGSVCSADTIFLSDTSSGGSWRLTNNKAAIATTGRVIGISAGIDTALYIINNSCGSDTARAVITVLPLPNPGVITGAASVCIGATITLRDTTSGGVWSSINSNASVADSLVTGVAAGTDTIKYTVSNSCGSASAIKKITIYPYPFVDTISGPSVVCTGATITLANSVTGGLWSRTNSRASISALGIVTGLSAGLDTIKYTVTANSCASVATKSITVLQLTAGVITGPATVCVGSSITLADTVSGGAWTNTNHFSSLASAVLTGNSPGTDTVSYTVTGTCGTVATTKKISIAPQPDAGTITGGNYLAIGDTVILKNSVSGGLWAITSNNAIISAFGVVGGLKEGKDTVLYIVSNTCGKDTAVLPITIATSVKPGTITDIKLYPNPSRGDFKFTIVSKVDEAVTIVLANSAYQAFDLFATQTNTLSSVKLDYLANGVYFLSAISKQGWHTVKFVIAR